MKPTLLVPLLTCTLALTLHAQSPFPLKGGGIPTPLPNARGKIDEEISRSIGRFQNVVETTQSFILLADGRVAYASYFAETVATDIVSLAELPGVRMLAVDKDGKLVFKGGPSNPGETLPPALAALTDAVRVETTGESSKAPNLAVIYRKNGQVSYLEVTFDYQIRHYTGAALGVVPRKGVFFRIESGFLRPSNSQSFAWSNGVVTRNGVEVATGAYGVFEGPRHVDGFTQAVAILKPKEIAVTEAGAPKATTPAVPPPALAAQQGLRATRAARALAATAATVNPLENESAVFFGRAPTGTTSAAHRRTFTITNSGAGTMTLGTVTVDGANLGDFAVTQPAVTTLARFESVEFAVQFTPAADGERSATLHIASDDEDEAAFDLELTGFGQAANATPAAVVDTLTAPAGGATTFTKLLANDTDADSDPLKIVAVAPIASVTDGFVTFDATTGLVAYTSPPDIGTDSFAYTITDGTTTVTGTVNVNVVDPVPLAAGKTFRGAEDGDSATVTFGKLTPAASAARVAARLPAAPPAAPSTPKLAATFMEQLGSRTYRGKVSFDAEDNGAQVVLAGSEENVAVNFEITVDEDGAVKVVAGGLDLLPDVYDARHPAPAGIVGTYTMALPGASPDDAAIQSGPGDSVASVILRRDGVVTLRGFMADGQSFTGAAYLGAGQIAPFNIPLYRGRVHGRFTGELVFDPDNTTGSLTGRATWTKPPGIRGLPMPDGFTVSGELVGGFYTPDELPATLAFTFSFGEDAEFTDFLATGTGTLAKNFALNGTRADTTAFRLDSHFTRSSGLITGARPRRTTTEPLSLRGVILQEQEVIAGSAVFLDPGLPDLDIDAELFTAPVSAPFPP